MVPCGTLILPYLYLGDQSDASDPERLKCHNIYYVLNVTADLPGEGENHSIHYKRIPARDSFDQNLVQYFEESFKFIEEARQSGRAVLIHCHAGISRSPTIVIAYLMFSKKMNFDDAFKFVADKRPKISPNFSFVGQLCEYEKTQLRPATTITLIPPSSTATTPSPPPPVPFKAPGVPFVPALAIVINIYLIFRLSILTLVRFSIWMTIDFIMIFGYGIKNSSLEKDPYPQEVGGNNNSKAKINQKNGNDLNCVGNQQIELTIPKDRLKVATNYQPSNQQIELTIPKDRLRVTTNYQSSNQHIELTIPKDRLKVATNYQSSNKPSNQQFINKSNKTKLNGGSDIPKSKWKTFD